MNRVGVPVGSESKSYYKYFLRELKDIPAEKQEILKNPVMPMEDGMKINDRNMIFDAGYLPGEIGIFPLEEGGYCVANKTFFPDCTGEMLQWWFGWHGVDPLRYAIWDPLDHYGLEVPEEDKAKILNPETSIADKCREVHHTVLESLVPGEEPSKIEIFFRDPALMGFDAEKIFTDACSFLVTANVEIVTPEGVPNMPVVMLHTARDVEGGCEMRTRFWLGYQTIDGVGKCLLPPGFEIPLPLVASLLSHNFFEFTNLGEILPSVYAEEKDNWA